MRDAMVGVVLAGVVACNDPTPVGTVLGERDFSGHIPEDARARVSAEDHVHRFQLGETGAEVEAQITTGTDSEIGAAWVRGVRFVVIENDGQQIHPPGISGPVNMGTTEKLVASYAFQIAFVKEHVGRTESGTEAGRFSGDGSFASGKAAQSPSPTVAPPAPPAPPARDFCEKSSDCVLTDLDCSPCGRCPGPLPAVNTRWLEHEQKKCDSLGAQRAPVVQCACPAPAGDESTWPTRAVCVNGTCQAR